VLIAQMFILVLIQLLLMEVLMNKLRLLSMILITVSLIMVQTQILYQLKLILKQLKKSTDINGMLQIRNGKNYQKKMPNLG
jgi:hypothetical protein